MRVDALIIGSGVAALSCAINLPKNLSVLLVTKDAARGANSYWAQGGVAVALDKNDVQLHIQDTIEAGAKRNNLQAVEILSSKSRQIIDALIALGMEFDKTQDGRLDYTKEGAHSKNRILHAGGDATGRELNTFLAGKNTHKVIKATVTDLLIDGSLCYGATVVGEDGRAQNIYARVTVIASGGMGGLYQYSTNASGIDANLQGICLQKGISLRDMHMIQFHPTVFVQGGAKQKFLLSEALRGEGAKLIDASGERFMQRYAPDKLELAPRDVISRSIFMHKQKTGKEVFLDLRHFGKEFFTARFPTIAAKLAELGFDTTKDPVPVSPAFHYAMGGITTDLDAKVPGLKNLYAVGEVASTMVHGANRLASNSLLEALVFGNIVAEKIKSTPFVECNKTFKARETKLEAPQDAALNDELKAQMWENAGIIRHKKALDLTLQWLRETAQKPMGHLLALKFLVAKQIVIQAIEDDHSLGAHFLQDP